MFPLFLFPPLANLSRRWPSIWAAVFLLLASACPAQSVLDDPLLREYRALETGNAPQPTPSAARAPARAIAPPPVAARSAVYPAPVAPASIPSVPAVAAPSTSAPGAATSGHVLFIPWASRRSASPQERAAQENAARPPLQAGLGAPRPDLGHLAPAPPPAATSVAPSATPYVERAPLSAVLDLDAGRNVDSATADALTLALWNEVQRPQRVHLQTIEATRHVLARQGLTPSDPYKTPPPLTRLSEALDADYLFLGNVDQAEGVWLLEVLLYSAATNSLVRSQAARSPGRFEGLLDQMPAMVRNLLEAVPARVMAKTEVRAAPGAPGGLDARGTGAHAENASGPSEVAPYSATLEEELQQLRRENARLNGLRGLGTGASTPLANTTSPPSTLEGSGETLPPVRYGNKEASRTKNILAKAPPAEPTPVAASADWPAPTPEPTPVAASPAVRTPAASEPIPNTPATAGTPAPAVTPARTPVAVTASPTPTPHIAPPPETPAADPQAEAKSLYELAMRLPKSSREALEPLRRAVELQPAKASYRDELMVRLLECKEYTDCARHATQLTREGKTDGALSLLYGAAAHTYLGDYKSALAALDLLLSKDPANGFALYNRAYNLKAMNDPRAVDAFEVYLKTAGNDPAQAQWVLDAHNKLNELRKATPASGKP